MQFVQLNQKVKAVALTLLLAVVGDCGIDRALAEPARVVDEERIVRSAVAVARELVDSDNIWNRVLAAGALVEVGDTDALGILESVIDSGDITFQRSAIDALLNAYHPNSTNLLYKTAAENQTLLTVTIESLASTPREDMRDLLLEALTVPNDRIRMHALQALAHANVAGTENDVQVLLDNPKISRTVRAYAYYVLIHSGHPEFGPELIAVANAGDMSTREVAAVALGLVDTLDSRKTLKEWAAVKDERVSIAATASNAGLGDDKSVSKIVHTIAYGRPMQAMVAAGSLKRLPAKTADAITTTLMTCCKLTADAATRVLESWGSIDADPLSVYKWGLAHEDADVRLQTVWLIGQRRDLTQISKMSSYLRDQDPALRGMAAWAIIRMAADKYISGLET